MKKGHTIPIAPADKSIMAWTTGCGAMMIRVVMGRTRRIDGVTQSSSPLFYTSVVLLTHSSALNQRMAADLQA